MNKWIRNYFGFSKTEARGFVILLPLMVILISLPAMIKRINPHQNDLLEEQALLDSTVNQLKSSKKIKDSLEYETISRPVYSKRTNYKFEIEKPRVQHNRFENKTELEPFDLNMADTSQLKQIRGIGKVLSARIVKYREILGGFSTKEQLAEVYGLSDEVRSKLDSMTFISDQAPLMKIDINQTRDYIMDDHPYISKQVATAIESYRYQHGKFKSIDDLYAIHLLDSVTIQKIAPYLSF